MTAPTPPAAVGGEPIAIGDRLAFIEESAGLYGVYPAGYEIVVTSVDGDGDPGFIGLEGKEDFWSAEFFRRASPPPAEPTPERTEGARKTMTVNLTDAELEALEALGPVTPMDLIEKLRAEEGNAVTILCDNPDFNGQPNSAVEVCADWTEWRTMRFTGDTLTEALKNVVNRVGGKVMVEAALSPHAATGGAWRPIETAPKDGTEVLIWNSEGHEIAHWEGRWEDGPDQPGHDEGWFGTYAFPGRSWGERLRSEPQGQPDWWQPLSPGPDPDEEQIPTALSAPPATGGEDALRARIAELEALVYVPGLRRCAKCGCKVVCNTLNATTGAIRADDKAQGCPNGCGPMWPVTEREAGNEVCDRLEALSSAPSPTGGEAVAWRIEELILPSVGFTDDPDYAAMREFCTYEGRHTARVTPLYAAAPAPVEVVEALRALIEADEDLVRAVNFCEPTARLDQLTVAEGASRAARTVAKQALSRLAREGA